MYTPVQRNGGIMSDDPSVTISISDRLSRQLQTLSYGLVVVGVLLAMNLMMGRRRRS